MNFFANFFSEFSFRGQVWTEFGTKSFFLPFSAYLIPFWLKIMPERGFLKFLNFFAIFFEIFLPGSSSSEIRAWNIFLPFTAYLIQFWLEILPERGLLIFWIFLLLFLEFSCRGRVWTEFGIKIFFSLSRPISSRFPWE